LEALCPHCVKRVTIKEPVPAEDADAASMEDLLPESAQEPHQKRIMADKSRQEDGQSWGGYILLEPIGAGAMGLVFKARHVRLHRVVALKRIHHGVHASEGERKRFLREAEAIARLRHPHIVTLYESGEQEGQPYLAMEYVAGKTLAQIIKQQPLPPPKAAECLKKIAEAVHYAHQEGVLHRDLKPSNVALDANFEPRVMDFGLARLLEEDSEMTLTGMSIGSPSYMAPEQAAGKVREVSAASDVYALGAILYEAVTGRPPFQAESSVETMRQVVENEPVSPRLLNASVPRDLETICLKCLEKERERRYTTAKELAEDLARFLRDEPICARPVSTAEKAWRWCRRNPALAATGTAGVILLLAVAVGSPVAVFRINRERRRAEQHAQSEARQRQAAQEYSKRIRLNLYASDISVVAQALQRGNLGHARGVLSGLLPQIGEEDLRGFEWRYFWNECQGDQLATLGSHDGGVTCAAFSPDGKILATGSEDQTVKIWDVEGRTLVKTLNAATCTVWSVAFVPNGRYLVTSGSGGTSLWSVDSWKAERSFPGLTVSVCTTAPLLAVSEVAFSEWWKPAGPVSVWNYLTGEKVRQLPKPGRVIAFAPDGHTLAVTDSPHGIDFWDVRSGELQQTLTTSNRNRLLVFSPDSKRLAVTGTAPTLYDLPWNPGSSGRKLEMHTPRDTWCVNFSPDSRTLATVSSDQTLRLTDADTLQVKETLRGHEHEVWCVAFSPDGKLLATGGKDQKVMLWSGASHQTGRNLPNQREFRPFFSPDGTRVVTISLSSPSSSPSSMLWNLKDGSVINTVGRQALGFSPDGTNLVRWGVDGRSLEMFSAESTNVTRLALEGFDNKSKGLEHGGFSPDWKMLFATDELGRVLVWDVATGKVIHRLQGPQPPISAGVISPRHLALGAQQESVLRLYELATGRESQLKGHKGRVRGLAFSPDGTMLASGGVDGTIRLWNTTNGEALTTLPGHMEETSDVAFSPDGRTLASVNMRLAVKLWHIATRRELVLWDFPKVGEKLRFSPDGRYLAVTTRTNSVHLFEAPLLKSSETLAAGGGSAIY